MKAGSLCTGYGGLDSAVELVTGAEVVWVADNDEDVCLLLEERFPGIPNLGDISGVDWSSVERVQVLCAGFPCQDVSAAGRRTGMAPGNRSGVWVHVAYAISILRPEWVIIENVRGICSSPARTAGGVEPCEMCMGDSARKYLRALGAVLGDLSSLGYDAVWQNIRASDVGSCHSRERIFILAWPAANSGGELQREYPGEPLAQEAGAQAGD